MPLEREVKMGAAPGFHMPLMADLGEGIVAEPHHEMRLETTYHDTEDLRLARWGCSLRFRQGEGWTLKLPAPAEAGALVRREMEFPGNGRRVPPAAIALVTAYVRHSTLIPVARLSTLRSRVRVTGPAGVLLAEVVDDEVSILSGRRVAARFRELEVELKAGEPALMDAIVKRLTAAGAGAGDPVAKHVRALGPAAQQPPEVHPDELSPAASAGDLVRRAIAISVQALMTHDPGVRIGDDMEDVHQARVATRRLRSHLRLFRSLLEPEWAEGLRTELSWLAAELGAVRDAQVLAERLRGRAGMLPAEDARRLGRLTAGLEAEVVAANRRLHQGIRSERYLLLLEALVEAAHAPRLRSEAEQPAAQVVPALARIAWNRLRSGVRSLPENPPDESLHAVRIMAKRARYAAEAAAPVFGRQASAFAKAVAGLQTVLGEHQDSVTAQVWLRQKPRGTLSFVAGELFEIERQAAEKARREWPAAWDAARAKPLRVWLGPARS